MNTRCLLLVFLLLAIGGTAGIARAAAPSITIDGAAAGNPATVYVTGQSQAINVAWNAGTDHTYCEVYYTTNNANQTELGRGHDGSKAVTFTLGSTFEFWMVVYPGNGQYSVVAKLNVVAKSSGLPPPKPGSRPGSGGFDERAGPKAGTIEELRNAPFISDVQVQPDYRNVVISFASTQSTPPLVEISKVPPSRYASGLAVFPSDSGAFSRFAIENKLRYVLDLDVQGQQLEIGTTYYYIISVFNNNRNDSQRPREQVTGQFTTRSQTVKIVWEKIYIRDDSDELSSGDCQFWFWANYGHQTEKSAHYMNLNMDSGENYFPDRTVIIENAPDKLVLHSSGWDEDGEVLKILAGRMPPPLTGANDHSVSNTGEFDTNAAAEEFDLSKYPGDHATGKFRLETRGGDFQFIVFGRFEITRGAGTQIGTTSSPLKTDPNPPAEPQQFIGTFGKTPAGHQPMWLYTIKTDGDMLWYRKDSGEAAWQGPRKVGNGWNFKDVIAAGGNAFYALRDDGKLVWYRHDGFNDGSARAWPAPVEVGRGWNFKKIFSGGEGIVYAIKEDGELVWYKHGGYADGGGMATWTGPKSVGAQWHGFKDVFSNGGGDIYAVTNTGELVYYHQPGYAVGERRFLAARTIATGWQNFRQIIPAGGGVILAVTEDGKLQWYRHYFKAANRYARMKEHWEGPVEIGSGWLGFKKIVALMPVAAAAPVVR